MVQRVEVAFKPGFRDPFAKGKQGEIADIGVKIKSLKRATLYSIDTDNPTDRLKEASRELFAEPLSQEIGFDEPFERRVADWNYMVHVRKKPGVKDTWGETSLGALREMGALEPEGKDAVFTSIKYLIKGDITREEAERIARQVLGYESVEDWTVIDRETYLGEGYEPELPKVVIEHEPETKRINLDVSDDELLEISRDRHLALNLQEMQKIRDYFSSTEVLEERRKVGLNAMPTDSELEVLAQTWSEHCKHKIFNSRVLYSEGGSESDAIEIDSLFKTYVKKAVEEIRGEKDWILSTLWDNSGVMKFNENYYICFKIETHNSPSAKHPYGGAITGIVGVYRDPMGTGMGVKLILGTYGFCTGMPFYEGKKAACELKPEIAPPRLHEGVRFGVQDGGNKSGVPTPYGRNFFHPGFTGKPAIYVGAYGLLEKEKPGEEPSYEKMVEAGDLIVMCGGRVGIDGIHGATESSLEGGSHITLGHVQMGDPYTQKKMHDFLLEARELRLYHCIQDNGAGGLSSSVGEMGNDFGRNRPKAATGFEMELDNVPLKYQGLDSWQIIVSESQERMSLAVAPDKIEQFIELAKKHDVETSVLGEFNNSGKYHTTYKGKTVTYMDMEFVHGGVPRMELDAEWISPEMRGLYEPVLSPIKQHSDFLKDMLARPNIASKEYIIRQFDHEVQATSVVKPLVGKDSDTESDAVILRPDLDSDAAIAVSAGINPDLSEIDTYHMTANALDEAIRRVVAVGCGMEQIAMNDNFCWPSPLPGPNNPDAKYKMAQLVRANQALYEYTKAFGTPCISGKDSMSMDAMIEGRYGEEHRVSAPPTIQFSALGKMDSWERAVTMDVKDSGDLVYVLGITKDECGGSEFYNMMGETGLNVPEVDAERSSEMYVKLNKAMDEGIVKSAHGCYKGGLGVALAQTAFGGGLGINIDLASVPATGIDRDDKVLYSESAGRLVVTINPDRAGEFENMMSGSDYGHIGSVGGECLSIRGLGGDFILNDSVYDLKKAWQSTFSHMQYHPENEKIGEVA